MSTLTDTAPKTGIWRTRIGSLLAVVPLSIWVVVHLWNNLSAFQGGDRWQDDVTTYAHPVAHLVTSIVVLLPLVLHTVWGVGRLLTSRPNNVRYGFFANLKYLLQRLSAVGLLLFLGAHLWLAMLKPRLVEGHAEAFSDIAHQMRTHMPTLVVYLLGTAGISYHVANGLSTFAMGWGIVSSKKALARVDMLGGLVFVVLLAMGWGVIWALWQAGV
jgi:succinate dehydrogenase / fumarate reductase cytochrome b subunit